MNTREEEEVQVAGEEEVEAVEDEEAVEVAGQKISQDLRTR